MNQLTIAKGGSSVKRWPTFVLILCCFIWCGANAQDSSVTLQKKVVTLKEVVVRNNLNVAAFIERIKNDTTFYKAFRNLKVIGYTSLNDIRMFDKKGTVYASLNSRTKQHAKNG